MSRPPYFQLCAVNKLSIKTQATPNAGVPARDQERAHRPWNATRLSFVLLVLFSTISLLACSEQSPLMPALAKDAVILAFGDSLTEGTGAKRGFAYPRQLQNISGYEVINAGIAGEVSADGLKRLPRVLTEHSPDLVILCHGGNDLLRKLNITQLRHNLERMIDIIRQSGAEVVLVGVPKPALLLGPADVYVDIAEKYQLVANLDIVSDVLSHPSWKADPVHPNAAGYQQIAQAIHATLSDAGAL